MPVLPVPATPPYALEPFQFSLPALASCAGRSPLGGDREMALGTLVAAKLALVLLPPFHIDRSLLQGRAERAKTWLSGLTMPQPARMALLRVMDATANAPHQTGDLLAELSRTLNGHLDPPSQNEIAALATRLHLYYEHHSQPLPLP